MGTVCDIDTDEVIKTLMKIRAKDLVEEHGRGLTGKKYGARDRTTA